YDTKHGPQPRARGTMLLDRATLVEPRRSDAATRPVHAQVDGWRGYRIDGDRATLNFEFDDVRIKEQLSVTDVDADARTVTIRRTINVDGRVAQDAPVILETPGSSATRTTRLVEGEIRVNELGSTLAGPAELPVKAEEN